jgi:hypothetical protein
MPSNFHPALEWRLPLSGAVNQTINPWTWFFNTSGSQVGLININLGHSSEPELEQRILDRVGSYGRQIGQIGDALGVLLNHLDRTALNAAEQHALEKLEEQLDKVAYIKREYRAELRSARALPD